MSKLVKGKMQGGEGRDYKGTLSGLQWFHKSSVSKLIKMYPLNMCSLLYVNYTSIKLFLKSHWKLILNNNL